MSKRTLPWVLVGGLFAVLIFVTQQTPATPSNAKEAAPEVLPVAPAVVAAPAPAPANPGLKTAVSRVTTVTVYPNSALITREVDVPEGQGTLELIVSPLPPMTIHSSLYTEGTETIRALMTRFRTRPILEDTREDVHKLNDELKQLQLTRDQLEADAKALVADTQLLTKLENFTAVTTIQATEKGAMNSEATIALSKFIMESRGDKTKGGVGLQQRLQANQDKVAVA